MKDMISVIIRNKSESNDLEQLLSILKQQYSEDIDEIIVVDNESTDASIEVAKKYNSKVVTIQDFSYGRACNLGVENASGEYCVFLSSHIIPFGEDFFKNISKCFTRDEQIAGLRYCKNLQEVKSYYEGKTSLDDLNAYGIMNAASVIKKSVWEQVKFNEDVNTSEDKIWTRDVALKGYKVAILPNIFFYLNQRTTKEELSRYKKHKKAMKLNPDIYEQTKQPSSLYSFLHGTSTAFRIFLRRFGFLLKRLWIDLTN